MSWVLKSLALFIGLAFALPSFCFADIKPHKITIGLFDTAPYNYVGEGTFHENISELFEQAGLEADFKFIPFKRGLTSVMSGRLDMMAPLTENEERREKLYYVKPPVLQLPFIWVKRSDVDFEWNGDIENLKGKRIGFYRGAFLSQRLAEMIENGEVEQLEANDVTQMLRLIHSGRVDTGVISQFSFQTGLKELGLNDELIPMQPPLKTLDLHLVVNKEVPNAREIVQRLQDAKEIRGTSYSW